MIFVQRNNYPIDFEINNLLIFIVVHSVIIYQIWNFFCMHDSNLFWIRYYVDCLFAICLKHEYRPTNEVKLYLCSNFSSLWSSQVFKAIDPKQNSSSSAEVQALKNQLHEKEKYIAQIEVKTNKKQCQLKLVFISIVRLRTGWEYHQNLPVIKTCFY